MSAPSLEKDDVATTRKAMYAVCTKANVQPTPELLRVVLIALRMGAVMGMISGYPDGYVDGADKVLRMRRLR